MNTSEGLLRIASVVRWAGWILGGAILLIGAASSLGHSRYPLNEVIIIWAITFVCAGIVIGIAYAVAWIIEGFAKPKA